VLTGQRRVENWAAAVRSIAARAAALARPGTAVGVTAGPLAAALAEQLAAVPALTVVTNCHAAATVLSRRGRTDQCTVLLGGTQTRGGAYTGALAVAAARLVSLDVLYLGVTGMTAEAGYTVDDLVEAETSRALLARARRVVVAADHLVWGRAGLATVIPLAAPHVLVTEVAAAALWDAAQCDLWFPPADVPLGAGQAGRQPVW
jgi:DeoR/GlpR family transcriptional regulator of sugar metabolism